MTPTSTASQQAVQVNISSGKAIAQAIQQAAVIAATPEPQVIQQGISYLLWIAYTCPLQSLIKHAGAITCAEAYLPCFSAGILLLNTQFRTAQHRFIQAPAWVRCMHCGKLHPNSLSIGSVFISQCPDCELKPKGEAYELGLRLGTTLQTWLRTYGIENLSREQMLSFNAQANALIPHMPNCTASARTDGFSQSLMDAISSESKAELQATLAQLQKALKAAKLVHTAPQQALDACSYTPSSKPLTNPKGRTPYTDEDM